MKKMIIVVAAVVSIVIVGELFAKYFFGLGDPPLSVGDKDIDYMFTPNQLCNRFGNRIVYNDYSMRCDFSLNRTEPNQRIFVVGDSVINGGVLTDHKDLATTILQNKIDPSHVDIQVLNVSAGSWGPGNYAAYFKRYKDLVGTNDILVVEVNSHDLWEDDPIKTGGANVGKDVSLQVKKPFCALYDGVDRYLIPRVRKFCGLAAVNTKVDIPKWGNDIQNDSAIYNIKKLDELYSYSWRKKYMLIYRSRKETHENIETVGERVFREYAKEKGITIIECKLDWNMDFRDSIHTSKSGQKKIAESIASALSR